MLAGKTYDVVICGAGSGGGFLAGEIAPNGSVLILDAGPHVTGKPEFGFGSPERRRYATQYNLGNYIPDGVNSVNRGASFFSYPIYMDASNPVFAAMQREARVVGGGSFINVGAWVRPRTVDWEGFEEATGIQGWTKEAFEPYFQRAESILHVHRDRRENWNPASVLYESTAKAMGIPVFETASNRHRCIFCGHRLNAGMPCKYDALMSTAITQIPKAIQHGAELLDNATVLKVEIENGKATGVVYRRNGEVFTVRANKLVVVSAGAIGTPAILFSSEYNFLNANLGKYLRAHPGIAMDALLPGRDWESDRGYQWNAFHYVMDEQGRPMDVLVHVSAAFPGASPWIAAQVGFFGKPYKDLMRRFRQRAGAFLFGLKPNVHGRVVGSAEEPVILYPVADKSGLIEPKMLREFVAGLRQVGEVYRRMGAITTYPNANAPDSVLHSEITQLVTTAGALHPQGTCRAGAHPRDSVVDANCMSHNVKNLMMCDASVIPDHISSNPNAMIMAVAARAADFVNREILGARLTAESQVIESEVV